MTPTANREEHVAPAVEMGRRVPARVGSDKALVRPFKGAWMRGCTERFIRLTARKVHPSSPRPRIAIRSSRALQGCGGLIKYNESGAYCIGIPSSDSRDFLAIAFHALARLAEFSWSLYVYAPTQGAPIFFAVAFGLPAIFHIYQCYRPLVIFIMSQVFTFASLLSWSLQTTIYWAVFSFYFVPHHAPLKPSHVLATFGALMVVVEASTASYS
ncbi:hypothetical protein PoMZ_12669 [Pyricularia oryzae]|uniref:Uncharacterized protein n=1 Tax=Pyricularia oryzae TaxID=318829 RepID=A0A4P7NUU9_PYROR|nr:hypothetical protein PoMZ_12669 [Pyricularia oryzae]